MLCKVTHCAGHVSANTRPHQLYWGDRDIIIHDIIVHDVMVELMVGKIFVLVQ